MRDPPRHKHPHVFAIRPLFCRRHRASDPVPVMVQRWRLSPDAFRRRLRAARTRSAKARHCCRLQRSNTASGALTCSGVTAGGIASANGTGGVRRRWAHTCGVAPTSISRRGPRAARHRSYVSVAARTASPAHTVLPRWPSATAPIARRDRVWNSVTSICRPARFPFGRPSSSSGDPAAGRKHFIAASANTWKRGGAPGSTAGPEPACSWREQNGQRDQDGHAAVHRHISGEPALNHHTARRGLAFMTCVTRS